MISTGRFFAAALIFNGILSVSVCVADVTIGAGASAWNFPLSTNYHDARTQTIYFASEIGIARNLTSLALYVTTTPNLNMNNFTIRLKHTDLSAYSTSPVWESSEWTTVYQVNRYITTAGWVTFAFSTPFAYNGIQNLMVDISFNNSTYGSNGYCYCTSSSVNRSIYCGTNSVYGDPLVWTNITPTPGVTASFPNIRLASDKMVAVPSVVNMLQATALDALQAVGFAANYSYAFSDSVPEGNVISQSPGEGLSVSYGASINLVLSLGQYSSGGSGTASDPYRIASAADLQIVSSTPVLWYSQFILTADIDLSGQIFTTAIFAPDTDSATSGFQGMAFTGTFDGNGHTIKNFSINGDDYLGLFGYVSSSGQITNLCVENINITGRNYIGGLVGYQYAGVLSGCYVNGTVSGTTYVGGLAGYNSAFINNCYSLADVSGSSNIGGLLGYNNRYITNCYSAGPVSGTNSVGGLVGYQAANSVIRVCFWDTQTSGQTVGLGYGSSAEVVGKVTQEMKTISTFADAGWNISNPDGYDAIWIVVTDGQDYPQIAYFTYRDPSGIVPLTGSGTQQEPYQIGAAEDIVSLSQYYSVWDKYFILTADLDMDGWTIHPIGNSIIRFTGNFNGQDHVISNLTINLPNKDYVGLFGHVGSGGVISNLGTEDVNIVGKKYVGSLAGYNSRGIISHCHSSGWVAGKSSSSVGGLIGQSIGGTISHCYSSANLTGAGANVGGLIGCNFTGSTISNCSASGTVTDNDPNNFGSSAGGLVGCNRISTITYCSATGNVSSTSTSSSASINIGGLVGESISGTLSNCYATGNIHAVSSGSSALISGGGFVGLNTSNDINDCYATGSVTFDCSTDSGYFIGGMLGLNNESLINRCYSKGMVGSSGNPQMDCCVSGFCGFNMAGEVYGCFWDILSSGKTTSGGGRGLATEQMKTMSIYQNAGWANNGWIVDDGQDYPHLAWEGTEGVSIPEADAVDLIGSGTAQNPYEIWTVEDFAIWGQYASVLEQHTVLRADLDFGGIDFKPIGEYGPFTGTFDGNGHVIRNITITRPTDSYVGLFGYVGGGGIITNLGIESMIVSGGECVGGMAGKIEAGTVSNCYSIGTVNGFSSIGGLIGSIEGGTVNNCYSDVTVTAWDPNNSSNAGGLIGYNNSTTVSNCYARASVHGQDYVGGLAGNNEGLINSCCALGSVDGMDYIGGFAGSSSGAITACYANVSVSATGSHIGGLLGKSGLVNNCYSVGSITGGSSSGGLAGSKYYGAVVNNSFWDTQTSGKTTSAGGTGKTTVEMKTLSTFTSATWDFTTIWAICEGTNYPRLRWQIPAWDAVCPDGTGTEDLSALSSCWLETVQAKSDVNDDDKVNIEDVLRLSQNWLLTGCAGCNGADITDDGNVNEMDLAVMTEQWLLIENVGCRMMDLNANGNVDLEDWAVFAGNWMEGI
jgi:hypothetical protein